MKRFLKGLLIFLGIVYILACGVLFFIQEKILFLPSPLSAYETFHSGYEKYLPMADGTQLHCIHMTENKAKGVVLYLHGNRGNNRHCYHQALNLFGLGYDVFMPDYRGYGKSGGSIRSQKQFYEDMVTVYDYLLTKYEPSQIKVLGYSIGTAAASHLAMKKNPSELILVAPYKSILYLKNKRAPIIPGIIVKYPFKNDKHLKSTTCPVTIIHGTGDRVIPFENSVALKEIDPDRIQLVPLDGTGHRRAIFSDAVRTAIKN